MARELQNFSRGNLLQGFGADNFTLNRGLIRQSLGNVVKDQAGNIVWESTIDPATGVGSADLNAAIKTVNNQGQWSRLFFNGGRQLFGPQGVMGAFTRLPYEDWFTGVNGYGGLIDIEKQIAQLYFANPSFTDGSFAGAMTKEFQGLWQELKGVYNAQANILKQGAGAPPAGGAVAAGAFATGGPVGVSFKPKGTDTVPAMLTPGEFVMKKSAVDKYGMGFMSAINGGGLGNTGPYFANGGSVSQFGDEDTRIDRVLNTVKSNAKSINNTFGSVGRVGSTANSIKNGQSTERTLSQSIRDQVDGNSSDIINVMGAVEQTFTRAGRILDDMLDDDTAGDLSDSLDAMDGRLQGVNLANMAAQVAIMSNAFMNDFAPRWLGFEQQFLQQAAITFGLAQDFTMRMNALKNDLNADPNLAGAFAFATGGSVPGAGNRDTVPAMLTPGEFVMKKSAVGKYGNSFMSAINSGAIPQMFANGGPVIPTNFWMGNDGQPESQQSLQGLFNYFKPPGQTPLFGADTVKAYKNMMDFTGRGFWKKSGTSPFDPTKATISLLE